MGYCLLPLLLLLFLLPEDLEDPEELLTLPLLREELLLLLLTLPLLLEEPLLLPELR